MARADARVVDVEHEPVAPMLKNGAVVPALPQPMPSSGRQVAVVDDRAAFEVGRRAAEGPHEADDLRRLRRRDVRER